MFSKILGRVLMIYLVCEEIRVGHRQDEDLKPAWKEIVLHVDDPLPEHDVYFTWTNYEPNGSIANTHYIWNGEDLGMAEPAGKELLKRFRDLPPRSRVLIYPSYYLEWQRTRGEPSYPWFMWHASIEEISISKDLKLLFSPRDHLGNLHPHCIPPEERVNTTRTSPGP